VGETILRVRQRFLLRDRDAGRAPVGIEVSLESVPMLLLSTANGASHLAHWTAPCSLGPSLWRLPGAMDRFSCIAPSLAETPEVVPSHFPAMLMSLAQLAYGATGIELSEAS